MFGTTSICGLVYSTHGRRTLIFGWNQVTETPSDRFRLPKTRGTRIRLERRSDAPDPDCQNQVSQWLSELPPLRAIDLFAGAGGLSLGLQDAGFSVIVAADSDPTALETHSHNIGGLTWCGDLSDPSAFISQLDQWGIRHVDLVAGGPPCQPFSRAGSAKIADLVRQGVRKARDQRADLWRSFLAVIDHVKPQAVMVENVPDFARIHSGSALTSLLSELDKRGYDPGAQMLDSWRYGVPQPRKRLFIIGLKGGSRFHWPSAADRKPTLKQAIGDLPVVEGGQRQEILAYPGRPLTKFARQMRRNLGGDDQHLIRDHITREVRVDDAEIYAGMKPGQTYKNIPDHLKRYRSDIFDDKYNRLAWNRLSRSITAHIAKDGYWYIHPSQDRTLSVREAARIQAFPDDFRFAGTPTNRYRQIGNAVPPMLSEAVGRSLIESMKVTSVKDSSAAYNAPSLRDGLVEWYRASGRSYPWRYQDKPWTVLLAEVCLHRTRADQVAGIFQKLADLCPSPEDLLKNRDEAESLLAHLGLNWRVDRLFQMAVELSERYKGEIPDSYDELMHLPGVGDYVASSVLCFAFGQPTTLIDTNTSRIVRRFTGKDDLPIWEQRLTLHDLAKPIGADPEWNYSLLDLGALVCTATRPRCNACPVNSECVTGRDQPTTSRGAS